MATLTLNGSTSGNVVVTVPAISGTGNTVTIPATTGTLSVASTSTSGGIFFGGATSGVLYQDASNLYWDDTNNVLGLGTNSPLTAKALTLNNASNYYGLALQVAGTTIGQIMQESTGNIYIDAGTSASVNTGSMIFRTNQGTERMRIDSSGRVTMPYQTLFMAYGSTTQSWSGALNFQILQLSNQYSYSNHVSAYNTSTYTFTAPVAGTYLFFGKLAQAGTTGLGPSLYLFVNGSTYGPEMAINYGVSYCSTSGQIFAQLAANDAVTLQVSNNNNTTFTLDLSRTVFGALLIG